MARYYVSTYAQFNGDYEVHVSSCEYLPEIDNRKYLGDFINCAGAVWEAKKTYPQSNGCKYCAEACYTEDLHNAFSGSAQETEKVEPKIF